MKALFASLLLLSSIASATTYDIGPGFPLANLRDAPWTTLNPGDIVNVHVKPGGYHEIIEVSRSGTAAQHIVIHGVPDPVTGALPILDGSNATTDPSVDWRNSAFANIGLIVVSPRLASYSYGNYHVSFIDIENLDIRNALYNGPITDKAGAPMLWDSFACGIYIEWAHDLAVRGCEISNCGNGIFANSKNGAAQSSARLLIEHNYFHDNSLGYVVDPKNPSLVLSNGYHEHHCYIESAGVIYQYNHFGQLRPNCHGAAIKDRSSGQIIRYNDFDMLEESNAMALLDPQGGVGWIDAQPDYRDSFVYGNQITVQSFVNPFGLVWWGAFNGGASYPTLKRGVLHFYNNTTVIHDARVVLFSMPSTSNTAGAAVNETVDCRNNVFFADTVIQSNIYNAMTFSVVGATNGGGNITLGVNWISPGWQKDSPGHPYGGLLLGTNNLLVGDSTGANNPRFVNTATHDYHVLTGSNVIDASGALGITEPPVLNEYLAPQAAITRSLIGAAFDLGAVESSGTPPPPPVGGSIGFNISTASVAENAGSISVTVTRTGGSTGAISIVCASNAGSATSPADFTANTTIFTWATGDTTSRTFTIPIINDAVTELAETFSVTLSNITGGAGYGPNTQASITINDDDVPPSQPIIAITGLGALIRFNSGTPGTILSNVNVTSITSPQTMRGLAFRRSTGQLYVIGADSGTANVNATLYTLNPATGVLTSIASMTLAHPSFDLGFDPNTDQLHVFGSTGQHLRIDATTGAIIATDPALAFATGDAHFGAVPGIVGADFTPGLTPSVYAIDKTIDALVQIVSSTGKISTIGLLGKDTEGLTGLDFTPGGTAFAVLSSTADTTSNLYTIDLVSGHATALGTIGVSETVRDLVVATPGQVSVVSSTASVTEGDGSIAVQVARTGGSWGQASVNYATSNLSASAGSDYTAQSGFVTWQDGEVGAKTITIPIVSDLVVEGDETFGIALSNITSGALLIAPTTNIVTIHERPYDVWKNIFFGNDANVLSIAGDDVSPAPDGLPNLLKYALGMNPLLSNTGPTFSMSNSAPVLSFNRDLAAPDVLTEVEVSADLTTWFTGSIYSSTLTVPNTSVSTDVTPLNSPAGFTVVKGEFGAGAARGFMRLRAIRQ